MQLAAGVLRAGDKVVWIDVSYPLPGPRLVQILSSYHSSQDHTESTKPRSIPDLLSNLTHFTTPTLPHLFAFLHHTTSSSPDPNTTLIVIDSLSTLISSTYPRSLDVSTNASKSGPGMFFYTYPSVHASHMRLGPRLTVTYFRQHRNKTPKNGQRAANGPFSSTSSHRCRSWLRLATSLSSCSTRQLRKCIPGLVPCSSRL